MSKHDGHRERLRDRFIKEGLDHFTQEQVLELLLFYSIPRQDTNEIAHDLVDYFGSLHQVLEAPVQELQKVEGIGERSAVLLRLIAEFSRYYQVNRAINEKILNSIEACGRYLVPRFVGRRNETVFLLCLDAKCKMLCCREISEGTVNAAGVSVRKVVETALAVNASSVVLAHNHPSGMALPSTEDVVTTRRIAAALRAVDVILVDHLVISDDDYVSLRQSNMYLPEQVGL